MAQHEQPTPMLRITFLTVIVGVLFVALFSRLWFVQVLAGERYAQLSEQNRVQIVYTEAPRGRILTADGKPLVKNRPALTVTVDKRTLLDVNTGEPKNASAEQVIARLAQLLGMPVDDIMARLTDVKYSPFKPVPIATDVDPKTVFTITEHQELFPGVTAQTQPVRTYPKGDTAAHLLGYNAEISAEQLTREAFADYRLGDIVGQAGLEQSYEHALQGERGRKLLEVNARGVVLSVVDERAPVPGNDLLTSIDLQLQRKVEKILVQGMKRARVEVDRTDGQPVTAPSGAAVVLDVDTGQVLAMASAPSYDPRKFVGGVGTKYFNDVYRDVKVKADGDDDDKAPEVVEDPDFKPTGGINRAISTALAPGSTFKAVTGAGFLHAGLISTHSTLPCPPVWSVGGQDFRNWNSYHDGIMDISRALKRSCDTFFYEVASHQYFREERAIDNGKKPSPAMQHMARQFGFDQQLGIDLPNEVGGTIPDRQWKKAYWREMKDFWCTAAESENQTALQRAIARDNCENFYVWRPGDSVIMSIGQGQVTATPLQIASAYAAIANGGKLMWPHVGDKIVSPDGEVVEKIKPKVLNEVPLTDAELGAIRDGLEAVVMDPSGGTAYSSFAGFDFDEVTVAGKTGTAEATGQVPDAWFAAYAPTDNAEIAVAVLVEEGSSGSQTAAPIARGIIEAYFGLDVTEFDPGVKTD